jgi:zinc protease
VDKPGAPQTQVRVASVGVPRSTPDYEALRVMNEALGGLFSSRINLNLREEHGYTYGASSQFVFRRAAGPFVVASGVRTDVTAPAVTEILKEVKRIRDTALTPDELALAKDSLVRSLPSDFQTSARVTASTAGIYIYDLGLDYFSKYPSKLSAVTAEQAKAASEKYLVPDGLIVVAVGDRAKIGAPLQKLNLGAVEVRNADATLAKRPTGTSRDGLGRGDRFLERRHASIELLLVDRLENLAHARTGLHAQLQQMSPEQDGFGRPTLDPE